MRTFVDAKAMAKSLRSALGEKQVSLTHSESLEFVAAQFGLDNRDARHESAQSGEVAGREKRRVAVRPGINAT
jgi:hypothetical protein